jgi:hypothetical protein
MLQLVAYMAASIAELHAEIKKDLAWVDSCGWKGGNFTDKRTCDHCGAYFVYGTAYRHHPTNEVIVVGWECAQNTMDRNDRAELEYARLVNRVHNVREIAKTAQAAAKRKADFFALYPDLQEALKTEHRIVKDIAGRFEDYGSLTEKQVALVRKLAAESKLSPAERGEPEWVPVEEGRRTVEGEVLVVKGSSTPWGWSEKMLLKVGGDKAEKIWLSKPRGLDAEKGRRVRLTVTVARSEKDPCFGLGSRPTKAVLLA